MQWSFGSPQETAFFMGEIQSEIATTDDMPSSIKFFIHIFFDLLSHLLLVRSVFKCVVDYVLGLVLDLRLHLRVEGFDPPFLHSFLHLNQYYKLQKLLIFRLIHSLQSMIIILYKCPLLVSIISSIIRRIIMKKNISLANLSPRNKPQDPLSCFSMLSCRISTETIRSPRPTHNTNMEIIPHEQSFDCILKRFKLEEAKTFSKGKVETERKGLSIHAEGRTMMRQKILKKDSLQTERIHKNLQILKERYILLPDINLKLPNKRLKESIQFTEYVNEDCDYERHGKTANKLRKQNRKQKKQKHANENKPSQQTSEISTPK